jgi:cytochrome c
VVVARIAELRVVQDRCGGAAIPRSPLTFDGVGSVEYVGDHTGSAAKGAAMTSMHKLLTTAACLTALAPPAFAAGDAEAGRALYQARCTACHSMDYNGVGPAHRGVFARPAAQAKGFAYSDALKASRLVWTEEALDRWLTDPEKVAPGQRMGVNVPDAKDRADLIAYLKSASTAKGVARTE